MNITVLVRSSASGPAAIQELSKPGELLLRDVRALPHLLAYLTGWRKGEIASLRWADGSSHLKDFRSAKTVRPADCYHSATKPPRARADQELHS